MTDKIDDQREQLPGGLSKNGTEALLARCRVTTDTPEQMLARFRGALDYAARDRRPPPLVAIDYAIRDSPTEALLARAREVGGDAAADRLARETLVHVRRLLETWWTALLPAIDDGEPPSVERSTAEDLCERGSWLPGFIAYLRQLGASGAGKALQIDAMPNALSALREVRDDLPQWLRTLVRVVWDDRLLAEFTERDALHAPALPFAPARALADMQKTDITAEGFAQVFAPLAPPHFSILEDPGLKGVSTIVLDNVLTFLLVSAFDLCCKDRLRTMYDVHFKGGQSELLRALGARSHADAEHVSRIFSRLSKVIIGWNEGGWRGSPRPLAVLTECKGGGLVLGISPIWVPGLVHLLGDNVDKRLVPWVQRPSLAAVGSRQLYPRALQFFRRMMIELTEHAPSLSEGKSAPIKVDALARECGLKPEKRDALLDAWTAPGGPFVRDAFGFALAPRPELAGASDLLSAGGSLRKARSAAGKAGADARRVRKPKRGG